MPFIADKTTQPKLSGFVPDASEQPSKISKDSTLDTKQASTLSSLIKKKSQTGLFGFGLGVGKGALETLQNIGQPVLAAPALLPGGKKFGERLGEIREETGFTEEQLEPTTPSQKFGKFVERTAEFAVPLTKVSKAVEGGNFFAKLAAKVLTASGVATVQSGEVGEETVAAGGVEAALSGLGPAFTVVRRLTKGLASTLSGVSTDVIDTIIKNPDKARAITNDLNKRGNFKILEDNSRVIVDGVSKVRQEARKTFGDGLEKLKLEDITKPASATS